MVLVYFCTMNTELNWQPSRSDIEWTLRLIHGSKAEATFWGIPDEGPNPLKSVYLIDRRTRTFTLVHGPEHTSRCHMFGRIGTILRLIGWSAHLAPAGAGMTDEAAASFWENYKSKSPAQAEVTREMVESMTGKGKVNQLTQSTTSTGTNT